VVLGRVGRHYHFESWRSAANYQFEYSTTSDTSQYTSWRTFSIVQWMHSKTLTSERHPVIIPSEFRRPAFTKFGDSLSSAWSISANLGDDGHTVRQSCDPSVPFRFPISFFGQTNRWQLVANARYLLCAAKHPFLALGKEFLNTISGYPSVRFPTGSGRWTGCLRLNFMPSHARDET
jgi:hypothetical protein